MSNRSVIDNMQPGTARPFAQGPNGEQVELVKISRGGTSVSVMTWGASVQDVRRREFDHSLVLGSDDFAAYLDQMLYFGAIVGPVANRIRHGQFSIDGELFDLEKNENDKTTLHSGYHGVGQRNWTIQELNDHKLLMSVRHPDGEGGFPGNVDVTALYSLDDDGVLTIDIEAKTDKPTHLNFAHHGYWNLDGTSDLSKHRLQIAASHYLPVDDDLIPLGKPEPVAASPFDYRKLTPIISPGGKALDHNFCIDRVGNDMIQICALAAQGVQLEVLSTEPGLQVYNALTMDTSPFVGHGSTSYGAQAGLALEPQNWPDAANHPHFPSTLVRPGETYRQVSGFRFHVTTG